MSSTGHDCDMQNGAKTNPLRPFSALYDCSSSGKPVLCVILTISLPCGRRYIA